MCTLPNCGTHQLEICSWAAVQPALKPALRPACVDQHCQQRRTQTSHPLALLPLSVQRGTRPHTAPAHTHARARAHWACPSSTGTIRIACGSGDQRFVATDTELLLCGLACADPESDLAGYTVQVLSDTGAAELQVEYERLVAATTQQVDTAVAGRVVVTTEGRTPQIGGLIGGLIGGGGWGAGCGSWSGEWSGSCLGVGQGVSWGVGRGVGRGVGQGVDRSPDADPHPKLMRSPPPPPRTRSTCRHFMRCTTPAPPPGPSGMMNASWVWPQAQRQSSGRRLSSSGSVCGSTKRCPPRPSGALWGRARGPSPLFWGRGTQKDMFWK